MPLNKDYIDLPKVTVLMATFNGMRWIEEQVESILMQEAVSVQLIVSDDGSTDGTCEWLTALEKDNKNVKLLCNKGSSRGAAENFYHLIEQTDTCSSDYVALADQDDIWFKNKLSSQIETLKLTSADGVSSDVIAFWPDGSQLHIIKSNEMKKFDFIFESAGPGCTYLLTPELTSVIQGVLKQTKNKERPELHDWFIYAVARANNKVWSIDTQPTLEYRQHDNNLMGVNRGWLAKLSRLSKITNGWYRQEVTKVARVVEKYTSDRDILQACETIKSTTFKNRLKLIPLVSEARRSKTDRALLYGACSLFLF